MATDNLPLHLRGVVQHGDKRGRVMGFATANLKGPTPVEMAYGVYASQTTIPSRGPQVYRSVTSYGVRPTFAGAECRIETHILDFEGDLYDCEIDVRLVAFLRGEQRFTSVEALMAAVQGDIAAVRAMGPV